MTANLSNPESPMLSIIVPARNEEQALPATLAAIACARRHAGFLRAEVLVVDNASSDRTAEVIQRDPEVRFIRCDRLKAPCARNAGAACARGHILIFVDADTRMPRDGLSRIAELATRFDVGIFGIDGEGRSSRGRLWWCFWNAVRRLPLAHAKALPAFMFCTRSAFDQLGPFDETVVLGEEWPLTAGCYRRDRSRFIYDRTLRATTSNRRMDRQPWGYTRTFLKYVWAVLHRSGRLHYADRIR